MATSTLPLRIEALEKARDCDAEKLELICGWMNGNGTPGAKTRIALLEDSVKRIETKLDKLSEAITRGAWAIVSSIGIAVIVYAVTNLVPKVLGHIGP